MSTNGCISSEITPKTYDNEKKEVDASKAAPNASERSSKTALLKIIAFIVATASSDENEWIIWGIPFIQLLVNGKKRILLIIKITFACTLFL